MDVDSLIKVAAQFSDLKDASFPSCFKGWESDAENVAFELISGHFLIDTPFRVTDDLPPGDCLAECKQDPDCTSVNIDYQRGTCEYLSTRLRSVSAVKSMRPSMGQNYFEKTCTPVKGSVRKLCPDRDWTFERVRNSSLEGFPPGDKVVMKSPDIKSRESCQLACMNFTAFPCRSCEFNYVTQECSVSPYNRFSSNHPDVGLKRVPDVDYFESNCVSGE